MVGGQRNADADSLLRIFTPANEMAFAGHPTLGSAHALLRQGIVPKRQGTLVQQCGVGLVHLKCDDKGIRIALPIAQFTPIDDAACRLLEQALGTELLHAPQIVDLGVKWLTGQVASGALLRGLHPDMDRMLALTQRLGSGGNIFGLDGEVAEVRPFAPHEGTPEDPVCGSGNGAVAYYLRQQRGCIDYTARQGRCIGRDGYIDIAYGQDGTIWLGGQAVTCIDGSITL